MSIVLRNEGGFRPLLVLSAEASIVAKLLQGIGKDEIDSLIPPLIQKGLQHRIIQVSTIKMGANVLLDVAGTFLVGLIARPPKCQLVPGTSFGCRVGVKIDFFFNPETSLRQAALVRKLDGQRTDAQLVEQTT